MNGGRSIKEKLLMSFLGRSTASAMTNSPSLTLVNISFIKIQKDVRTRYVVNGLEME